MIAHTPLFAKLTKAALDFVFPVHCTGCGREGSIICPECSEGLAKLTVPYCNSCAGTTVAARCSACRRYPPDFEYLRSPYLFQGPLRDAIHSMKYRGVRVAAGPLSLLMAKYLEDSPIPADVLVPTPLHARRLRARGYNQSTLLAKGLGDALGLPVREDLVTRVKYAPPQVQSHSADERRTNVAGAFSSGADVTGMTILLIDDVATTCSTISEVASVLIEAGAYKVRALTLAREGAA